jgi:CRP/FNR family transcriptional regulator, cyclic AMP receptor protein
VSASRDLIRRIDFFEPLDDKIISKIVHLCIPREYSASDHIVRQGDVGLGLYFITNGRVKVEIDRNAKKTIVAELQPGDFVGELSIIDSKPRSANVICLTDTSCLLLTRDSFLKLMNQYPEIAIQTARALAARLRDTDERVGQYSLAVHGSHGEPPDAVSTASSPAFREDDRAFGERERIKGLLADSFGFSHVLKSLTRFSLAVVGCPVTVHPEAPASEMLQTAISDIKLVLFPASEPQVLRLDAFGDGNFSASIFRPIAGNSIGISVSRFEGHLRRNESRWLCVPAGKRTWIERSTHSSNSKREPPKTRDIIHVSQTMRQDSCMRTMERILQTYRTT